MSSPEYRRRRAVNFDLSIDALKKYYSESNPKGAYKDIEKYMERNGFEHRQWSGYRSRKPLSNYELVYLFDKMYKKMPWLDSCAEHMDATTIDSVYDIKEMRVKNLQKEAMKENRDKAHEKESKPSVLQRLAENKKIVARNTKEPQDKIHHQEEER